MRSSGTPSNPLHKGRASLFDYWPGLWGGFLNPTAAGNAGTGNAKAVSVTVLRQRFRSDDMVGGAASAAPPTD